ITIDIRCDFHIISHVTIKHLARDTKLKYKQGTCFSCRKCLYCGVDLQTQKCKCDITKPPHRGNRTKDVKYAYTRIFTPNWIADQVSFVREKILQYNYSTTLKDSFNFSLCSRCNNELSRLKSAKKKSFSNSNSVKNKIDASKSRISKKIKLDPEICDLTSENE
ncbi:19447_t:CDS:2, partial [Dentiscutata erythropus]